MDTRTSNLTYKSLEEFKGGDTVFISKMDNGFQTIYLCRFVSFKKGILAGEIIDTASGSKCYNKGQVITCRPNKAYLWGQSKEGNYEHAHWFKKQGKDWKID